MVIAVDLEEALYVAFNICEVTYFCFSAAAILQREQTFFIVDQFIWGVYIKL